MLKLSTEELSLRLKKTGVLAAWIAGTILIAFIAWFFTSTVRERGLIRVVNETLEQHGQNVHIVNVLDVPGLGPVGTYWFSLSEAAGSVPSVAVVFTIMHSADNSPFLGLISEETGALTLLLPLSINGQRMLDRIEPEMLQMQTLQIESAYTKRVETE
jgi:hypothetical protein